MPTTACNRAPRQKRRKGKTKASRQSQSTTQDAAGWKNPKRTSPPQEVEDSTEVRTSNSYQLLATEESEQSEIRLSDPGLPEKRKTGKSRSRQKHRKKVTVTPALKVAERDPSPVNPEMVKEPGINQTGAQTDESLLAAEEAQATGTPVEGPKEVRVQVLEQVRSCLEESDAHGIMADGTQLPFYGILRLPL